MTLYHGTSGRIAERILHDEAIIPNGTESFTHRTSDAGAEGPKRTDISLVYMMDIEALAIPFGWARACGTVKNGQLCFSQGKRRDAAVVFGIDAESLNPESLTRGGLTGMKWEFTYRGIIPGSALRHMIRFPISRELEVFAKNALHGEAALSQYVGIDLVTYLHGKTFDIKEAVA